MIESNRLVLKFSSARFWVAVAWCVLSGGFVQPARAGDIPVFFVENRGQLGGGQSADSVRYMVKGTALTGYFSAHQVMLAMGQSSFRMSFPGANPAPALEGIHDMPARVSFMVGDPSEWRAGLPAYGGIA